MIFLILLIKGFLIGIAFIIPGVSGGTLAMYLGVYQELLDSIGNILKDFKKSVKFLFPIFLGIGISIVALAKLLSLLLNWNSFIILFFFIGLIIGGIKHIYKKSQTEKITISMAIAFILSFGLLLALVILGKASPDNGIDYFTFNFWTYLLLIGLGALASITMIVPGISGSAVLLVLGFYTAIVSNVVGNIFDFTSIWYNIQVIVPFAVGALIGIVIFSKLLGEALRKFPKETYFAILGFIIMSAIGVFLEIKDPTTAAEFSDQLPIYENLIIFIGDHIWSIVGGIIAFVGGYIGSIYMTKLDKEVNRQ